MCGGVVSWEVVQVGGSLGRRSGVPGESTLLLSDAVWCTAGFCGKLDAVAERGVGGTRDDDGAARLGVVVGGASAGT